MKVKKKGFYLLLGLLSGFVGGLFGGGGGMIALPFLRKTGLSQQEAGATSLGVMLPLCVVSLLFFLQKEGVPSLPLIPLAIVASGGSLVGGFLLPKMKANFLRRLFGGLLLLGGLKILLFS